MKKEILELALKGMDRKTLVANANALIMSLGEHHITDALFFGMPQITNIDINKYVCQNNYAAGRIGDFEVLNKTVNIVDNQVIVTVKYNCIRYTNADALNRFIKRDSYNRKSNCSYKGFAYWNDISNECTDKNNIPFLTKAEDTYYIGIDSDYVTYIR